MPWPEPPIELDREVDGRCIAEFPSVPGVMVYGESREDAIERVRELYRLVLEDNENHS